MHRRMAFCLIIIFFFSVGSSAQVCGPNCPICSGSGNTTGGLIPRGNLLMNFLYLPGYEEESGVLNIRGGVTSWLDVGLGYTVKAKKPVWSVRIQPMKESESSLRPSLILGTGSIQTGGSDQSLFFLLTKAYEFSETFSARLSAGAASLFPDFNRIYFLANLTVTITDSLSPFLIYDGLSIHYGLSFIPFDWLSAGILMVEAKYPSFMIGFRWGLGKKG